jgi:hypothetical protein
MTITKKILCSNDSTPFTLYKEGLLYKCYNEDAIVFTKSVKNYKVNSKFIKSLGAAVFSLDFPVSEVAKGNLSLASAQAPPPPPEGGGAGGSNNQPGGGAPIGSCVALLLTLAATYGMKKLRDYYKKTGESIEE